MSVINNMITDLRKTRLWPVAVALVVALIAVPVILSSGGGTSAPAALAPLPGGASASVPALPAVSVTTTPSNARLTGAQRNPFRQQVKAKSTGTRATSHHSAGSGKSTSPPSGSSHSAGSSAATGAVGGTTTTVTSTTTITSPAAPTPTPTGLTATQAYRVTISTTSASGGVNAIDPVERLSVLPSQQLPLLVELGVLDGGHRVAFLVQPGTVVNGLGKCTPGPIDCEILSLATNETEGVATTSSSGAVTGTVLAVTGISAEDYSSAGAADRARLDESAAGRRLFNASTAKALGLFLYKPSLGAVVDLSNVTVGGS
jgi:hypothetical protein